MNEKKLEKLITDGFASQLKFIDKMIKDERIHTDQQFKEIKLEMVTHNDLDQKFENNTQLIIKEMDRRNGETNQRFNHVLDELNDIRATLEEINVRNNEEVADLYKRVNLHILAERER